MVHHLAISRLSSSVVNGGKFVAETKTADTTPRSNQNAVTQSTRRSYHCRKNGTVNSIIAPHGDDFCLSRADNLYVHLIAVVLRAENNGITRYLANLTSP